jgi:hypothetical protein
VVEIVGLFVIFFFGNWTINKLEKYLPYAVRRFASLLLTTVVIASIGYLFVLHTQYIRYTVAIYYFLSAISFLFLVLGAHNQIYFMYKLHDYIVGHTIFILLGFLATLQLGYFQTWLLYYDAISSGVEMKDILNYARQSKERATDESELINNLKKQVAQQEKTIREILDGTLLKQPAVELTPINNYTHHAVGYKGSSFGYGSIANNVVNHTVNPLSTIDAAPKTKVIPTPQQNSVLSPIVFKPTTSVVPTIPDPRAVNNIAIITPKPIAIVPPPKSIDINTNVYSSPVGQKLSPTNAHASQGSSNPGSSKAPLSPSPIIFPAIGSQGQGQGLGGVSGGGSSGKFSSPSSLDSNGPSTPQSQSGFVFSQPTKFPSRDR